MDYKGKTIMIDCMDGEPQYSGRTGVVNSVNEDPWGDVCLRGTWGGCSVIVGTDSFHIIEE